MCYGYHARLSKDEEKELLKMRKKHLEERLKKLDETLSELEKELTPATQSA